MPETLYPRQHMLLSLRNKMPINLDGDEKMTEERMQHSLSPELPPARTLHSDIPRTTSLPFLTLFPIPGMPHPKPWDSLTRLVLTFKFPVVVIAVIGYSFTWYWWTLSVITMLPAAYPQYSPIIQGLLFIGLLLGTVVSEICFSGRLSDFIVMRLMKRNGNVRTPEMRLWLSYPAILMTAG